MIESDVNRLEDEFDVTLPSAYRNLLLNYPVRFSAGTTDQPLWDDVDALIERNRKLKSDRKNLGVQFHPIPSHYFLIGEDGGGWQFLIDLRDDTSIVYIMEFERVDQISPSMSEEGRPQNINEWLHSYLLELRHEGIDIGSDTPPVYKMGCGCIIGVLAFCIVMALVCALMVIGIESLTDG